MRWGFILSSSCLFFGFGDEKPQLIRTSVAPARQTKKKMTSKLTGRCGPSLLQSISVALFLAATAVTFPTSPSGLEHPVLARQK
jgi:hypothetical protein